MALKCPRKVVTITQLAFVDKWRWNNGQIIKIRLKVVKEHVFTCIIKRGGK